MDEGKCNDRDNDDLSKLVILDLRLLKMDGLEILNYIKSDERTKSIPVVILTSSKEEIDKISGYKLGANSYKVKPVDYNKFMTAVRDLGLYWMLLNVSPK